MKISKYIVEMELKILLKFSFKIFVKFVVNKRFDTLSPAQKY